MKKGALVIALPLAAAAAVAAVALGAPQTGNQDACLDVGGAWFGELGCEKDTPHIDRIVIEKSKRHLAAYEGDRLIRQFSVALGRDPVGPKERQGDSRTPEGIYPVVAHNPNSAYHLSLRLGYPTRAQIRLARQNGIDPGGDIMIHGLPNGMEWVGAAHVKRDWTLGCIALTDDEIEWLYRFTADGTPVEIRA